MKRKTALLNQFEVYGSQTSTFKMGCGYRIMYEHTDGITVAETLLFDNNGHELPPGIYHLVMFGDDYVVELRDTVQ